MSEIITIKPLFELSAEDHLFMEKNPGMCKTIEITKKQFMEMFSCDEG